MFIRGAIPETESLGAARTKAREFFRANPTATEFRTAGPRFVYVFCFSPTRGALLRSIKDRDEKAGV